MSRQDEKTPPDEVLCRQGSKGRTSLGEATIAGADVSTTGHVCGDARQGRAHKLRACLVQRWREVRNTRVANCEIAAHTREGTAHMVALSWFTAWSSVAFCVSCKKSAVSLAEAETE